MRRTRKTVATMQSSLRGIADRARRDKTARFGNLYALLNEANLRECFRHLRKDAAPGVDKVTFEQYEANLSANLADLVERLKKKTYRAKLVRRKYIPKANGKLRSLGIPALEDKLLQLAVARILEAIYEPRFLECSWGYRPNRGAREASRVLANQLYRGWFGHVVEADIKGFFDNISHAWMVRMLEERINDAALRRLITKWLKAGIMEETGEVKHPVSGTPQGGIVSPVLANIYLHHALDLWFEHIVKKQCQGEAYMMRYADDFVCAFRYKADAQHFERQLPQRLGKFGLEVAPGKTRALQFSRFVPEPNEALEFLGFEFRWVKRLTGQMGVQRRTAPKKLLASVKAFCEWIRRNRRKRTKDLMKTLAAKLRGYWNYYGVRGNMESLHKFYDISRRLLFKWMNRRSQRRSYSWKRFLEMLSQHAIPAPCIKEEAYQRGLYDVA
jgi:group II intron reverse transcriptase/maturase